MYVCIMYPNFSGLLKKNSRQLTLSRFLSCRVLDDVAVLDLDQMKWSLIQSVGLARCAHTMIALPAASCQGGAAEALAMDVGQLALNQSSHHQQQQQQEEKKTEQEQQLKQEGSEQQLQGGLREEGVAGDGVPGNLAAATELPEAAPAVAGGGDEGAAVPAVAVDQVAPGGPAAVAVATGTGKLEPRSGGEVVNGGLAANGSDSSSSNREGDEGGGSSSLTPADAAGAASGMVAEHAIARTSTTAVGAVAARGGAGAEVVLVFGGFSGGAVEGGVYRISTETWGVREEHGGRVTDAAAAAAGADGQKGRGGGRLGEGAAAGRAGDAGKKQEQGGCPVERFAHAAGVVGFGGTKVRAGMCGG